MITNPHALVVHNEEPGKVVLLGAEAGEWTVAVKTTDGSTVKYDVTVKSVGSAFDINHAAKAPGPIVGSGATTGTAAPVVAKMEPGTGPVGSPSSPASTSASASSPRYDLHDGYHGVRLNQRARAGSGSARSSTPPAPISHSSFDFAPSSPAAS